MLDVDNKQIAASTLYARNISKTFGGTQALKSVEILINPSEIMGLVGQNGCGKSTLIKIFAGYHNPDEGGELWINGERVSLPLSPGEYTKYGMSFVHQDLGLVNDLTVLENFCLNKISTSSSMYIDWKAEKKHAEEVFKRYKIYLDPEAYVASLSSLERAMLAIIRAVEDIRSNEIAMKKKRGLLVLDEPTVFLPRTEVDVLFNLVRNIAAEGISVLFVSHDIDEVKELTTCLTVLRDGRNVGTEKTANVDNAKIIELILGETLQRYQMESRELPVESDVPSVEIKELRGDIVNSISFSVREGEVLGITGLMGSGFEEVPYLLFGATANQSGKIIFEGQEIDLARFSPGQAVQSRMALIPSDRPVNGAVADLLVKENLMMQVMDKFNAYRLQHRKMDQVSKETINKYRVTPSDPNLNFSQLSGGNQQKVLLAKWMLAEPKLLILHEPTQGVDVGARQQLYKHIEAAAKKGTAVLCCSSDYEQLEQICNRVLILHHGKITNELVGEEVTKNRITHLCFDYTEGKIA